MGAIMFLLIAISEQKESLRERCAIATEVQLPQTVNGSILIPPKKTQGTQYRWALFIKNICWAIFLTLYLLVATFSQVKKKCN